MDMSTSILSLCVLKYKFIVDPGYKLKRMLLQDGYNWWGTLGILILVLSKIKRMTKKILIKCFSLEHSSMMYREINIFSYVKVECSMYFHI